MDHRLLASAAFTVPKLVGAAYLVYLGIAAFRHRHDVVRAMQRSAEGRRIGAARSVAIALVLDSVWALAAGSARDRFASSPRRIAAVGGAGGLAMIGLGVGVAATGSSQ